MKRIIATGAALLMAAGAVVVTGAPAQATKYELSIAKNGEQKAYAFINNENRRACVRALNSNSKAVASVVVRWGGNSSHFADRGGDADRNCHKLRRDMYPSGAIVELHLTFTGAGGWSKSEMGYAYIP